MNDEKFKAVLAKYKTGSSGDSDGDEPAIGSIEEFTSWKHDFLNELKEFLDPVGTSTAREADEELYIKLEGLAKSCMTTKTLCKEGKIGVDNSTVAGQRTINELCTTLKDCEASVEAYVPKTTHAAKKAGYNKFDLAAVAIRDGFRVYGLMCATRDYLAGLVTEGGPLESVLRDNQLATIMYFFRCLEAFAETMADLGIYRVMEDCVEVYKVRPRGKKKKRSKKSSGGAGDSDALALSSDEERALSKLRKKEADDEDDGLVNGGRMFSNKLPAGKKSRAIMDKGWSNGFAPGEEVKGPDGAGKKSKTKKSKKDKKGSGKPGGKKGRGDGVSSVDDDDGYSRDGTDDEDEDDNSDDPAKSKSKKSSKKGTNGDDGDGKDDDNSTTDPTEDEDDDECSSEEDSDDDDSDDEDYIYYFDPVQKVVGKLPRSACQKEKLVVTTDAATGAETLEGKVDHWDTKDEDTPGKTDLILTLRDVLRSSKQ